MDALLPTPETTRQLLKLAEAERNLLDYREPGAAVSTSQRLALADLIGRGWTPADAAERIQARPADEDFACGCSIKNGQLYPSQDCPEKNQ